MGFKIKIKAKKLVATANAYYFPIPKAYVDNEVMKLGEEWDGEFTLTKKVKG